MAYKQPKNTPLHNDGASAVGLIAGIGAGIAKLATAAKAAKVAKLAATGIKAAKAAKAAKIAATAAKAGKTAKAAKLAAKSAKLAKAGKAAKATKAMAKSTKITGKVTNIGNKASQKVLSKGLKATEKAGKIQGKMDTKLINQVNKQMGKSLKSGENELAKIAKTKAKADGTYSPIKDAVGKAKDGINKGFDKASDITGQDASDLKAKALQGGINQTSNLIQKQKAKNESSGIEQEINPQLGIQDSTPEEEQPRSFPSQDRQSSYSNPSGASYKMRSEADSNKRAPKTNFVKLMHNLQNNKGTNVNIGGVSVNPGSVGLLGKFLVDSGVDAVKKVKELKSIKRERENLKESAARFKEEKMNKKIMQDIDNRENNIGNKTFNKK